MLSSSTWRQKVTQETRRPPERFARERARATVPWQDRLVIEESPLVASYDALLLDLDGVVYVGPHPIPGAADALNRAREWGARLIYVTNNASRPPEVVAEQLSSMQLGALSSDVMTSAQAGAKAVSELVSPNSRVLAVGGVGVMRALEERGLIGVDAMAGEMTAEGDQVSAVLQGFGRDLSWRALARAAQAVSAGAAWVATNTDMTIPTEFGIAPGNGTLVAAVETATGAEPQVVGKPFPPLFLAAAEEVDSSRPLVVGDRLNTDILGAANANMPSLLVLTGVSGALDLWRVDRDSRPTHLGADLNALMQPALRVEVSDHGVTCGQARARIVDQQLLVEGSGSAVEGIWAAAHLIWRNGSLPQNAEAVAGRLSKQHLSEP